MQKACKDQRGSLTVNEMSVVPELSASLSFLDRVCFLPTRFIYFKSKNKLKKKSSNTDSYLWENINHSVVDISHSKKKTLN